MTAQREREAHYRAQNGSDRLTPRQRRRVTHKLNHQLTAAQRRSLQRAQAGLEPAGVILDELAGSKTGWTFRDLQAGVLPGWQRGRRATRMRSQCGAA